MLNSLVLSTDYDVRVQMLRAECFFKDGIRTWGSLLPTPLTVRQLACSVLWRGI